MALRIAFAGFRHGHILDLYDLATRWDELEVAGACEEHVATRQQLQQQGVVRITHEDVGQMLDEVGAQVLAVGDYFARRGSLVAEALSRGLHAIADKPLCTRQSEVVAIDRLRREKGLCVGCMLNMRDGADVLGMRQLILDGRIGDVHAISFAGQHPLMLGSRPSWYFEPGKHGGTITDIGIHAIDALPWMTGLQLCTINAARSWNAFVPQYPEFHDAGQMMLTMSNGCGVLGDVSYHGPEGMGYRTPFYWRMTFWGREGVIEGGPTMDAITVVGARDQEVRHEPLPAARHGGYLRAFLDDIAGRRPENGLDTDAVLTSMRRAILVQEAASTGAREVPFA
ncbi:MAG: Gfo/Idh/MocA family oxidoreductase [Candidatus Latescibacterota bacterium]